MKTYDMLGILSTCQQKKLKISARALLKHGAIPLAVAEILLARYEREGVLRQTGLRGKYAIYKITKLGRHFTDQFNMTTVKTRTRKLTRSEMQLTLSEGMKKLKLTVERIPSRDYTIMSRVIPKLPSEKERTDAFAAQVAERIRAAREMQSMTQEAFAKAFGCNRKTISAIETGIQRVKPEEMTKIAKLLGKPLPFFTDPYLIIEANALSYLVRAKQPTRKFKLAHAHVRGLEVRQNLTEAEGGQLVLRRGDPTVAYLKNGSVETAVGWPPAGLARGTASSSAFSSLAI